MSEAWFIQDGEQERGPFGREQLLAMLQVGELSASTFVRKVEDHVGQLISDYEELKLEPPLGSQSTEAAEVTHPAEYVGYFVSRVVRSDFSSIAATAHERQVLDQAKEPISLGLAQDYVAWRRSVLAVALLLLTVQLGFGWQLTLQINTLLEGWDYTLYLMFKIVLLASQWIGWGCLVIAVLAWDQLRLSTQCARRAWLIMVLVPLALFMFPLERLMGMTRDDRVILGASLASACFQWMFPKVLGLFPGLMRCAMTLKSLLPESPTIGWIVLIIAPLYGLLLLVLLAVSIHLAQSLISPLGFFLLALGPLVYLLNYQVLVRSYSEATGQPLVRRVRMLSIGVTLAGIAMLLIKAEHLFLIWEWHPSGWQILHLLSSILASVLLLSVVGADFLLAMLLRTHESQQSFQGTQMQASMLRKLTELNNVGLTN